MTIAWSGTPLAIKALLAREVAQATGRHVEDGVDFAEAETILDSILAASRRRYEEIVGVPAAGNRSAGKRNERKRVSQ